MPNTLFRVTVIQLLYGQQMQNVINFRGPSSDPLQMSALADEVVATWVTQIRTTQVQDVQYTTIKVRMLESQFAPFNKTIAIGGINSANDKLCITTASVWRLRAATLGRHGRGRVYIGGHADRISQKGLIENPTLLSWQARIGEILDVWGPTGSSTFRLVVCPSKPPFNSLDVVSMDINPVMGVQRRRNIGIGV